MKYILKFGRAALFILAVSVTSRAQTAQNLVAGTSPITTSLAIWDDRSAISLISGNQLFPASGATTVLYLGFTLAAAPSGEVDIGGMVLYQTKRNNFTIEDVIPLTFGGGTSNGILFLDSARCPGGTPSATHPCVVKLDPLSIKLLPQNDYYFVIYFTSSSNNALVAGAASSSRSTIVGGIDRGIDDTKFVVGDVLPSNIINTGEAFFLVGVMSN